MRAYVGTDMVKNGSASVMEGSDAADLQVRESLRESHNVLVGREAQRIPTIRSRRNRLSLR